MGLLDPPGFRRNRHGQVWMRLGPHERSLLADLLEQMLVLLAPPHDTPTDPLAELVGIDETATRPTDPALARLFPDAYEDPELADEFRRFTQRELGATKRERLRTALASLSRPDPTKLSAAEATAWLGALNDLRLTLGARLDLTEDSAQDFLRRPDDDPARATYLVYDWLTFHQDRLIRALDR